MYIFIYFKFEVAIFLIKIKYLSKMSTKNNFYVYYEIILSICLHYKHKELSIVGIMQIIVAAIIKLLVRVFSIWLYFIHCRTMRYTMFIMSFTYMIIVTNNNVVNECCLQIKFWIYILNVHELKKVDIATIFFTFFSDILILNLLYELCVTYN